MRRIIVLISFSALLFTLVSAQNTSLYIAKEYKQAYQKGTRNYNGSPGASYWINTAQYTINATIHPDSAILNGAQTIEFKNNSPDTMRLIGLKLKQNLFKKGVAKANQIPINKLHNGVAISQVSINNKEVNLDAPRRSFNYETLLGIRLNPDEFIAPNGKIEIGISWHYSIPEQEYRTGKINDSAFFIGYWFPQLTVYDDVWGFDFTGYNGSHETYNDISNINVSLKAPGNYLVWATGNLENENEIYTKSLLKRIKLSKKSENVVHIIDSTNLHSNKLLQKNDTLLWKFTANNVSDFAFAISTNYLWDACTAVTDKENNKSTWVNVAYATDASLYHLATDVAKSSIEYFSNTYPAITFPYNKYTTVYSEHGLGMEFPMMANDGNVQGDTNLLVEVIAHEIAHTYFPFYVNTNEKLYAWMDEGWVSLFGDHILDHLGYETPRVFKRINPMGWNTINDVPLMTPTTNITGRSWFHYYYIRSIHANKGLNNLMQEKGIENCVKPYMETWQGKHPTPYDFFFFMDSLYGEDLSWFWKPWYFEFNTPDLAIGNVTHKGKEYTIEILNKGGLPLPVHLEIVFENSETQLVTKNVSAWKNNNTIQLQLETKHQIQSMNLGNADIPDSNDSNNSYSK